MVPAEIGKMGTTLVCGSRGLDISKIGIPEGLTIIISLFLVYFTEMAQPVTPPSPILVHFTAEQRIHQP